MEEERDAAEQVKRAVPILVIIGNPPYNAFAGTSPAEEEGLAEPYKAGLQKDWGIRKFNLDELYVRFLRVAERRIVEGTGRGIVCFISSYSYLSDASFVVARRHLLSGFDRIWIDSLNGDSRETGKLTPQGTPDPSVFSTESNREGIKLGTSGKPMPFLRQQSSVIETFGAQRSERSFLPALLTLISIANTFPPPHRRKTDSPFGRGQLQVHTRLGRALSI